MALTRSQALDQRWMRRALALARRGEGGTRPNPPVGAVVVRGGRELGGGFHREAGGPHAEVLALRNAGPGAAGATLYVTLEPCSTLGKTPPCVDLVVRSGIRRVVVATTDPNPKHGGRGLARLRSAGIEVVEGVCAGAGGALIEPFAKWVTTGRPFVTLKMATTLDGRIADRVGHSRWISGPEARRFVQRLRRRADALLVGRGTAETDDPSLTCRPAGHGVPYRVIADSAAKLSQDARALTDGAADTTIVAVRRGCDSVRVEQLRRSGAAVWILPGGKGGAGVSLRSLLGKLGRMGLLHVVCEGGGELAAGLIDGGLVDRLLFFIAPRVLGSAGVPVVGGAAWTLGRAPGFTFKGCKRVGEDLLIEAVPLARRGEGRDVYRVN